MTHWHASITWMPRAARWFALALLASVLAAPRTAAADDAVWLELSTQHFVIVYPAGQEVERDHFGQRIEPLYEALRSAFGTDLPTPATLRLHPTVDSFLRANPLVVEMDGVLAGPRRGRREIEVVLPLARAAGPDGLDNAARREIASLLAARLAGDRFPDVLLEGVASYLESPDDALAAGVARLRDAWSRGSVHEIESMTGADAVYLDPAVTQPESRAFIQYLVDARGFAALVDLLSTAAEAPGWRNALEGAYGLPPDQLEDGFRRWLPSYLDGGWRTHALYGGDVRAVEALLRDGDYEGAVRQLTATQALLQVDDPAAGARVADRLRRAESGRAAVEQLETALAGLGAGDYATALGAADAARPVFVALGDADGAATATEAASRARTGLRVVHALARADALPAWRTLEARALARQAGTGFGALGNDALRDRALALAAACDRRLAPVGWLLAGAGATLLTWSVRRRRRDRALAP